MLVLAIIALIGFTAWSRRIINRLAVKGERTAREIIKEKANDGNG